MDGNYVRSNHIRDNHERGKHFFFCILLFFSFFAKSSVQLLIDSTTQYQAVVGEQFELDLVIKDLGRTGKDPLFSGDTPSLLQRTGLYMTSINGKTEVKYTYQVRFDAVGSYTIGPVKIVQNGVEYSSNAVTVTVCYGSDQTSGSAQKKDVFLELSVDTEFPVVGQEVTLMLSCFVKKKDVHIESITQPQVTDLVLMSDGEPNIEDRVIDNVFYKVVSWRWKCTPEKPGEVVIPAASMVYTTSGKTAQHFFFSFMSPAKRIFSNAVIVSAQNLPAYDKPVNGIGFFTNFSATLSQPRVVQGEAATVTLVLEGNGSIIPELKYELSGLPEQIKYYPVAAKRESNGYIFEYVVQAVDAGECIIPAQEFVFFDNNRKTYETISTTPLEMRITKNSSFDAVKKTNETEHEKQDQKEQESEVAVDETFADEVSADEMSLDERAIDDRSMWFSERMHSQISTFDFFIPWWLFLLILILLLLLKMFFLLVAHVSSMQQRMHRIYFFLYCSVWGRYRLYRIIQKDDVAYLYPLFRDIIAFQYGCSADEVYKYAEKIKIDRWENFWNVISSPTYSLRSFDIEERMKLYKDASLLLGDFTKIS